MAIRLPRTTRQPRRTRLVSDLVAIGAVSTVILLFALRCILSLLGIETWTSSWRLIDIPTGLIVSPLERIDAFGHIVVRDLTIATIVVTTVSFIASLVILGTLANQRN